MTGPMPFWHPEMNVESRLQPDSDLTDVFRGAENRVYRWARVRQWLGRQAALAGDAMARTYVPGYIGFLQDQSPEGHAVDTNTDTN
jgi:hypothetical protein